MTGVQTCALPIYLSENGKLYFEIGYKQGDGLRALLSKHFPQKRVRVLEDILYISYS